MICKIYLLDLIPPLASSPHGSTGPIHTAQVSPVFVQFGVVLLLTTAFGATLALCTLPAVLAWVERFDPRGTEPFELLRSEIG